MSFFNIFKKLKNNIKKPVSTIDALASLVSLHDLEAVVLKSVDKRSLINVASLHLGINEEKLIDELAEKMGVMSIKRLDPIDPKICGGIYSLGKYKEAGTIPLIREGIISGICGVCPILSKELALSMTLPFYLSDWERISKALKDSEALLEPELKKYNKKGLNVPREDDINIFKKVIGLVIKEADNYSSDKVSILCSKDSVKYQFLTDSGKLAEGTINSSVLKNIKLMANSISKDAEIVKSLLPKGTIYLDDDNGEFDYLGEDSFELIWYRTKESPDALLKDIKVNKLVEKVSDSIIKEESIKTEEIVEEEIVPKKEEEVEKNLEVNKTLESKDSQEEVKENLVEDNKKIKILVLEDNATFARVLQRFLEKDDYDIKHVTNGVLGIETLKSYKPDLILSDVHMPEMNGFEFIKNIKKEDNLKNIPTIMLTSDSDVETEVEFLSIGVDAFVSKSSDPRILGAHVKRVLLMSSAKQKKKAA